MFLCWFKATFSLKYKPIFSILCFSGGHFGKLWRPFWTESLFWIQHFKIYIPWPKKSQTNATIQFSMMIKGKYSEFSNFMGAILKIMAAILKMVRILNLKVTNLDSLIWKKRRIMLSYTFLAHFTDLGHFALFGLTHYIRDLGHFTNIRILEWKSVKSFKILTSDGAHTFNLTISWKKSFSKNMWLRPFFL